MESTLIYRLSDGKHTVIEIGAILHDIAFYLKREVSGMKFTLKMK